MSRSDAKSFWGLQKELAFSPEPPRRKRRLVRSPDGPTRRAKQGRHAGLARDEEEEQQQDSNLTLDSADEKEPNEIHFTFGDKVLPVDRASVFRDTTSGPKALQYMVQAQAHGDQEGTSPVDISVERYGQATVIQVLDILRNGAGQVPNLQKISRGTESLRDIIHPSTAMTHLQINGIIKVVEDLLKDLDKFKDVLIYVLFIEWEKLADFMIAAALIEDGVTDISSLRTLDDEKKVAGFVEDLLAFMEIGGTPNAHTQFKDLVYDLVDNRFVMTFKIRPDDVKNERSIILPYHLEAVSSFSGRIDWGDGTVTAVAADAFNFIHFYSEPGDYTIVVRGLHNVPFGFDDIKLGLRAANAIRNRLIDIQHWGGVNLRRENGAQFHNCFNLGTLSATDKPDLRGVTNLNSMFAYADRFNGDLSRWNVSSVTNMSHMFTGALRFTSNLSAWDVSNVTDMRRMFENARKFTSDLSAWDVSNVTTMHKMFEHAFRFTSDLRKWDVSQVEDMAGMFAAAGNFTSNLSAWDVGKVENMSEMFWGAGNFTSDLSAWDVSKVEDMSRMFDRATNFTSDLSAWNVSQVKDMSGMFATASSFKSDLSAWDVKRVRKYRDFQGYSALHYTDLPRFPASLYRGF